MDTIDLERRLREWADSGIYELLDREVMLLRESAFALAAQRDRIAVLEGALQRFLAAGDNSCRPDVDDVAAMLEFAAAEKQARAALGARK